MRSCGYTVCTVLWGFTACAAIASGQVSQASSTKVIDWVNNNYFAYTQHIQFAKHPGPAQIPVPPEIDPPCHVCGDTSKTQAETDVDAWISRSEEPEKDVINDLLAMERQVTLMRSMRDRGELTTAAGDALGKFDLDDMTDAIVKLANRLLYDKALPMGRKYDTEPKRFYAGMQFLSQVTREQAHLAGLKAPNSDTSADNESLSVISAWAKSVADGVDKDIAQGHQYNLCPLYADIIREAQILGGPEHDMATFQAMKDKIDKLMRFNVQMKLHATANNDDGSHLDITWSAKALLHLKVDFAKACYTPEFLNNGQMAVTVDSFSMVSTEGPIELTSARSFNAPVGKPTLNLCDPNPVLLIPFNMALMPKETLVGAGGTRPGMLFGSFLEGVVSPNNLDTADTNELSGRDGAGPATPDKPDQASAASPQLKKTQALLEAHQNDTAWLMSAEGRAAIARLQSEAMAAARPQIAKLNNAAGNASNLTDAVTALKSAQLKWTNGRSQPVSDTLKVDNDTQHYSLEVAIQQASQ